MTFTASPCVQNETVRERSTSRYLSILKQSSAARGTRWLLRFVRSRAALERHGALAEPLEFTSINRCKTLRASQWTSSHSACTEPHRFRFGMFLSCLQLLLGFILKAHPLIRWRVCIHATRQVNCAVWRRSAPCWLSIYVARCPQMSKSPAARMTDAMHEHYFVSDCLPSSPPPAPLTCLPARSCSPPRCPSPPVAATSRDECVSSSLWRERRGFSTTAHIAAPRRVMPHCAALTAWCMCEEAAGCMCREAEAQSALGTRVYAHVCIYAYESRGAVGEPRPQTALQKLLKKQDIE